MLSCLFGRCSSETYVVNQFPKTVPKKPEKIPNGLSNVVPPSPEPASPELASPTKTEPLNNRNTEPVKTATAQPVPQSEESNIRDNETVKKTTTTLLETSSHKSESLENEEKGENNNQTLPVIDNSDNKEAYHHENNTTVSLRTRPQAPQPPEIKVTVYTEETLLTSEFREPVKLQHEPVRDEYEPASEQYEPAREQYEPTREQYEPTRKQHELDSKKSELDIKEHNEVNTESKENSVISAPIIISKQTENNKKEKVNVKIHIPDNITVKPTPVKDTEQEEITETDPEPIRRRSGVVPLPVKYDESIDTTLPRYPKDPDDEDLIKSAIERNDFLNKIISGKRLDDVVGSMYNKEIASKETIIKQGEKGSHMYISAKGKYQVVVKGKVVSEFDDVRVFGELAILYNAKRLASIKAVTPGRVWVLDRTVYQQIMLRYNIKEQDEIMLFLMNNKTLNVVGKDVLQEVANLLKPEFFSPGKQIVRQGDKGHKFYIIRAGTVTITKEGEGVVGIYNKGDCFGELALLKEDCRQATVTANAPGVECLTLTRKEFIDYFGEVDDITKLRPRPQNSIKDAVAEHGDINLADLKIIKTLGVGGFGRVELVQHTKKKDLVFALKYLKKIDIVLQHQQEHVYNEKNIQMSSKSPFIIRLYRTYRDSKYIYFLMESCLGGDLWSLLQKQKLRRFEEKEARFIAACVLEAFDYLHSRGIVYRDLKPENLLIAANGYIKLTDFGFAKKISSRGRTYTFAGTPEYVAPEIVLNKGHDRAVDYWAFGAFIFELLTGRTPFRTDDSSHMKTYNKILNGIDNIQFPSYVNLKARHIIEKLCRPIPAERLGMQKLGIKDIKGHKWFLGWDWQKFSKCEIPSPFKPKLRSPTDTQYFDQFKKDTDNPPDELSGWDMKF